MKLQRVQSYQTSDGNLFTSQPEALTHQLLVDARGLIQSNGLGKMTTAITPTDIAKFIAQHAEPIMDLLRSYKDSMRRAAKVS